MKKFESRMAVQMESFLNQKRALGFSYTSEEGCLRSLDRYCASRHPIETTMTREIVDEWILFRKENSDDDYVSESRASVAREFAKFLIRSGVDAYVLPMGYYANRRSRYVPHIFNDSELKLFFTAADATPATWQNPHRHLAVPVIFRLLFCCGLRPKEALLIRNSDVDWATGAIVIRESKGHRDRRVVIGDDMLALCTQYRSLAGSFIPEGEFLFAASNSNGHFSTNWLCRSFNECLLRAGMTEFKGNRPRVYDFRHTFATQTLRRWLREGRDLKNCLPYLSAFMGHEKFEHTQYYIHFVPEFFSKSSGIDFEKFADLLPEVSDEVN
ncbi:MAG: tyrosine-type recombinase/integrase [Oscillospiraceae bacterium]|nr:tyrosine-type recombinase/integrase [Oscillospiraceae bacterium]